MMSLHSTRVFEVDHVSFGAVVVAIVAAAELTGAHTVLPANHFRQLLVFSVNSLQSYQYV